MSAVPPPRRREQREVLDELAIREPIFRYAIAGFVVLFGAVGIASALSVDGPGAGWPRYIAIAVCATTIPVGIVMTQIHLGSVWWSNRTSRRYAPELFVLYADIGVTTVLATFNDVQASLFGTGFFAIIGAYAAHFVRRLPRMAHVTFTSLVIIGFAAFSVPFAGNDIAGAISRAAVMLMVVNGTVALHSLYTTEIRNAIAQSHRRASTDPLTGIANRRAFARRARQLAENNPTGIVLLLIDIDEFKEINDTYGHDRGDEILVEVSDALQDAIADGTVIARIGGDEFALAAPIAPGDARDDLASRLGYHLSRSTGVRVTIGAAETMTAVTDDPQIVSTLLSYADRDLYARKRAREI